MVPRDNLEESHTRILPIRQGGELFTSRGCRRYEAQGMKLWYFTANAL